MLRSMTFKNYRCFENTKLYIRNACIIVGSNNAGKSTIIEALRLIASVTHRFHTTNYLIAPASLDLPAGTHGIKVSTDRLRIDLKTIVHQYKEDTYAHISACFEDKITIDMYLDPETAFATIRQASKYINSKSDALKIPDLKLHVMPQLGLIREEEDKLKRETVMQDMDSRLSSRHFRNELYLFKEDYFGDFCSLAQSTWKGLRISKKDLDYDMVENRLHLTVFDSDYAAEIGLMGSGLQMWLQIVWFISHCPKGSTIVLDEPDVYMHPDLQLKILKIIRNKYKQFIVATHSVEIISNVNANEIVIVDKKQRNLQYAADLKAVQTAIENLGSNHNLSLVRIGNAKRCVFVEGSDMKLLSRFHEVLYPDSLFSLDQIPVVELGGWTRFDEALGASRLFYEETNGDIATICILDKDYHSEEELTLLRQRATESHLTLYIWSKKEIENYIVTPGTVFRLTGLEGSEYPVFREEFSNSIDVLKEATILSIADQINCKDRSKGLPKCYKEAKQYVDSSWCDLESKLSLVNGKDLISHVNEWLKNKFNVSCSQQKLLSEIRREEVHSDIKSVIAALISP